jgi:hypothetical protein
MTHEPQDAVSVGLVWAQDHNPRRLVRWVNANIGKTAIKRQEDPVLLLAAAVHYGVRSPTEAFVRCRVAFVAGGSAQSSGLSG